MIRRIVLGAFILLLGCEGQKRHPSSKNEDYYNIINGVMLQDTSFAETPAMERLFELYSDSTDIPEESIENYRRKLNEMPIYLYHKQMNGGLISFLELEMDRVNIRDSIISNEEMSRMLTELREICPEILNPSLVHKRIGIFRPDLITDRRIEGRLHYFSSPVTTTDGRYMLINSGANKIRVLTFRRGKNDEWERITLPELLREQKDK